MVPAQYATATAIVLILGGLLACFAGFRLFRLVLGLYGFVLGALVTSQLMGTQSLFTMALAALVGGLVGAGLMVAAYFVGVGLIGAGLAAGALTWVWRLVTHGSDPNSIVLVIVAVLGALGALSLVRYVVVFGTALAGSWTLIVGALALAGDRLATQAAASQNSVWSIYPLDPAPGRWWVLPLWLVTAIAGAIVQLSTTNKMGKSKAKVVKKVS